MNITLFSNFSSLNPGRSNRPDLSDCRSGFGKGSRDKALGAQKIGKKWRAGAFQGGYGLRETPIMLSTSVWRHYWLENDSN